MSSTSEADHRTAPAPDEPFGPAQRVLIGATVVISGVLFSSGVVDRYALPRATAYVAIAVVLLALSAVRAVRVGRALVPRSPLVYLVAGFLATLTVAVVVSDHPMRSVIGPYGRHTGMALYATYAVLMLMVLRCHDRRSIERLADVLVGTAAFVGAYGVLQHAGLDPITWPVPEEGAPALPLEFATFGNVNFASGFIGIGIPIALWRTLARSDPSWMRWIGGVAIVLGGAYLVLSQSSQGPVAAAVGALTVLVTAATVHRHRWSEADRRVRGVVLAGLAIVAVAVAALTPRVLGYASSQLSDAGTMERRQLWSTGADLWQDSPIVGHGLGAFSWLFTPNRPEAHALRNTFLEADAPHNVVLEMAVGGGVLLALAYMSIIAYVGFVLVRGLVRIESDDERLLLAGLGGAWVAYQVQSAVSIDVPGIGLLQWILAGAIVVVASTPTSSAVRVPGVTPVKQDRASRRRSAKASKSAPGPAIAIGVVTLALLWVVILPVRADRAALRAFDARARGDFPAMLEQASRATDLAPWEARYWAQQAAAQDRIGNLEAARLSGRKAAARAPGNSFYALAVAGLSIRLEDDREAENWLAEAQRRDPFNPQVAEAVNSFADAT